MQICIYTIRYIQAFGLRRCSRKHVHAFAACRNEQHEYYKKNVRTHARDFLQVAIYGVNTGVTLLSFS